MAHRCVAIAFAAWSALLAGCELGLREEGGNPMEQPEFLTPVAEAQQAGVTVYWLGERFAADGLVFEVGGVAELFDFSAGQPGIDLDYGATTDNGSVGLEVESYVAGSPGAQQARARVENVPGASWDQIRVGQWQADVATVPAGTRPVNGLGFFISTDESLVIVEAGAGGTGVPGTDPNPLIDADALASVIAANLRPYPE